MAAGSRWRRYQHRKRLQNKNCFDRLCFSARSSLARPSESKHPKLSFLSRCLCMSRLKRPMRSACAFVHGEKSANEKRRKRQCRRFPRTHRSGAESGNPARFGLPAGSSEVRRTNPRRSTSSCNVATPPCLPGDASGVNYAAGLVPSSQVCPALFIKTFLL